MVDGCALWVGLARIGRAFLWKERRPRRVQSDDLLARAPGRSLDGGCNDVAAVSRPRTGSRGGELVGQAGSSNGGISLRLLCAVARVGPACGGVGPIVMGPHTRGNGGEFRIRST